MPPPVSPKSVYRLAHLLQREELQRLALDAISTNLTIEGAARELFSPVSIAYAEVKKVLLNCVVKNWDEVQASTSWKQTREKAMAGEIEGAAQITFDLLSALHGKDSKQMQDLLEPPVLMQANLVRSFSPDYLLPPCLFLLYARIFPWNAFPRHPHAKSLIVRKRDRRRRMACRLPRQPDRRLRSPNMENSNYPDRSRA